MNLQIYQDYLTKFHESDLRKIMDAEDSGGHYVLNIKVIELVEQQPSIAQKLLNDEPDECIDALEKACHRVQLSLIKEANPNSKIKVNVRCRFTQLPGLSAISKSVFPGNSDVGKFLQISGTVMRITTPKILEFQRFYTCSTCRTPTKAKADFERNYTIDQPKICENPEGCTGKNLLFIGGLIPEHCKDYQEIKIQEQVKQLGVGNMPSTMWVTLEDDLVDKCKPGDNITVCGVLKRRWNDFIKGKRLEMELALQANSIQVDNTISSANLSTPEAQRMFETFWEKYASNPLEGRDVILKSFCPEIYGLYMLKLAVAAVLAGGTPVEESVESGIRTRAESHLLLVGDPGTGKSNLLHFASKVIPRSVLTTGVGSTAAGLTVTAINEHGEWQLEAGALVMADGGICCIDEFSSMKSHDRTSIHEAMEQQSISVAKASMVCKLNTRCSILAACNPKATLHNKSLPLCMIVGLPSPLVSRFDLVMILEDLVNEDWDKQVADYILNGGSRVSKFSDSGTWTIEMLQAYFLKIKKMKPKLTDDTEAVLGAYYQMQRSIVSRNRARTTVRFLESLVRLSQGHAKLMLHDKVEIMDAIYAIALVDASMENDSLLKLNLSTGSKFPEKPAEEYRSILEVILSRLQLGGIMQKEVVKLNEIGNGKVQSRYFRRELDGNSKEKRPVTIAAPSLHQHSDGDNIRDLRTKMSDISGADQPSTSSEVVEVCQILEDLLETKTSSENLAEAENKRNPFCENSLKTVNRCKNDIETPSEEMSIPVVSAKEDIRKNSPAFQGESSKSSKEKLKRFKFVHKQSSNVAPQEKRELENTDNVNGNKSNKRLSLDIQRSQFDTDEDLDLDI